MILIRQMFEILSSDRTLFHTQSLTSVLGWDEMGCEIF